MIYNNIINIQILFLRSWALWPVSTFPLHFKQQTKVKQTSLVFILTKGHDTWVNSVLGHRARS